MALKTFVKVSGINNLSDARYCAGMGVNVLGFNVDPSDKQRISPEQFKEISDWLSGVSFAAEVHQSILTRADILQLQEDYNIEYIEVSSPQNVALLNEEDYGLKVILKHNIEANDISSSMQLFQTNAKKTDCFLLEANEDGAYKKQLLESCLALAKNFSVLIGFCITDNNVHRIIDESSVKGIALRGSDEIRPGFKDFDELADILEAIEVDD